MKTFQERQQDMLVEIVDLIGEYMSDKYSTLGKYTHKDLSNAIFLVKAREFSRMTDFQVRRLIEAGTAFQEKELQKNKLS